jgi:integrase
MRCGGPGEEASASEPPQPRALERQMFRVRRAYAKGRLKDFAKTPGSTRAVPLSQRVITALEAMPVRRRGILFPAPEGGRIDINNWRNRSWTPSLEAAAVKHRRNLDAEAEENAV